jgi:hypothetical protein
MVYQEYFDEKRVDLRRGKKDLKKGTTNGLL